METLNLENKFTRHPFRRDPDFTQIMTRDIMKWQGHVLDKMKRNTHPNPCALAHLGFLGKEWEDVKQAAYAGSQGRVIVEAEELLEKVMEFLYEMKYGTKYNLNC